MRHLALDRKRALFAGLTGSFDTQRVFTSCSFHISVGVEDSAEI